MAITATERPRTLPSQRSAPGRGRGVPTWATGAFYQAFVPGLVEDQLHSRSSLVLGLVFAAFMAPSVLGAPLGGRFTPAAGQRVGMTVFLAAAFPSLLSGQLSSTFSLPQIALGYGGLALLTTLFTIAAARNPTGERTSRP